MITGKKPTYIRFQYCQDDMASSGGTEEPVFHNDED